MISKAELKDAPELSILINSAYRGESSKKGWTTEADLLGGVRTDAEDITALITKPFCTLLKYGNAAEKIIGCVRLEKHGNKFYLGMLTVDPLLQGGGIGKKLMKAAEAEAKKQNCDRIYMTVISDRVELIAWYERHGYKNTGEKKPFPAGDPRFGLPKKYLEFVVLEKTI